MTIALGTTVAWPAVATAEAPATSTLLPPATVTPKRMGYGAGPAGGVGGGLPSIRGTQDVLRNADELLGATSAVAGAVEQAVSDSTSSYRTYVVEAWFELYNERRQNIFREHVGFRYRQSTVDGEISGVTPEGGLCRTGSGVAPHQPVTVACWWEPGYFGGDMFSFVSGATMVDYLGPVEYARISMDQQFVAYRDGSWTSPTHHVDREPCAVTGFVPPGWSVDCDVTRTEA